MEEIIDNYGILASISWNSNDWTDKATEEDLKASNFGHVKEYKIMHESLNFGIEKYPVESNGYYIGYTPMFNRPPSVENSKNVTIVFFTSADYKNKNKSVIGFYGYPEFGEIYYRADIPEDYKKYNYGNIKAKPQDIIYFQEPIVITHDVVIDSKLIPAGKSISQQGFNYLNSDNVYNIVALALKANQTNSKLKSFVKKFPLRVKIDKEDFISKEYLSLIGNSTTEENFGIIQLEKKMKDMIPEVKKRISKYIERGSIANKVKMHTGYKCQICEAKSLDPYMFEKPNGINYIETHHVEPVSERKKGSLGISNLITVCANHHRQLHYGNTKVLSDKYGIFKFEIDGEIIEVKKLTI